MNENGKCRAQVCRQWLYDQGRVDLASRIGTNRVGHPMRPPEALDEVAAALVAEAFRVAHVGNEWVELEGMVALLGVEIEGHEDVRHWVPGPMGGGIWSAWPANSEYV